MEFDAVQRLCCKYREQCEAAGKPRSLLLTHAQLSEEKVDVSLNLRCRVKFVLYSYCYVYPATLLRSLVLRGVDVAAGDVDVLRGAPSLRQLVHLDVAGNPLLGDGGGRIVTQLTREVSTLSFVDAEGSNFTDAQLRAVRMRGFHNFLEGHVLHEERQWLTDAYHAVSVPTWAALAESVAAHPFALETFDGPLRGRWTRRLAAHIDRFHSSPEGITAALRGDTQVPLPDFLSACLPRARTPHSTTAATTLQTLLDRWPRDTTSIALEEYTPPHGGTANVPLVWFHPRFAVTPLEAAAVFLPATPTDCS